MGNKKIKFGVSVSLPIRNEEKNMNYFVIPLYNYLKKNFENFELILVENGSIDKTPKIVDKLAKKYKEIRSLHLGYGSYGGAIIKGLIESKKEFILYTDSDGCIKPEEIKKNISYLNKYDAIMFYKVGKRESLARAVYSFFYNWLIRTLFLQNIKDVNFSFKMFRKDMFDKLRLGYGKSMWFVDVEMLVQLKKNKAKILWSPAKLIHRKAGASSVSRKIILDLFKDVLVYRIYTLFGTPKIFENYPKVKK